MGVQKKRMEAVHLFVGDYLLYSFSEAVEIVFNKSLTLKHLFPQKTDKC